MTECLPLLEKRAKWCDARARANHNDRSVSIGREKEMLLLRLEKHTGGGLPAPPVREKGGGDSFAWPPVRQIADGCDGEMHRFRMRLETGRDRVKPRRHLAE